MKIKIVSRGGRLYGYGVATPSSLRAADPSEGEEDSHGREDVERICEAKWRMLQEEEKRREELHRELREKERIRREEQEAKRKARRIEKIGRVLGWLRDGAVTLAMILAVLAILWMLCGEVKAAWGLVPMLLMGGRMQ